MSNEQLIPAFYGNVFQVTRTPWDVTLYVLHAVAPRDAKPGDTVNLLDQATPVATVSMPLEVGKLLIKALETVTADDAIRPLDQAEKETRDGSSRR